MTSSVTRDAWKNPAFASCCRRNEAVPPLLPGCRACDRRPLGGGGRRSGRPRANGSHHRQARRSRLRHAAGARRRHGAGRAAGAVHQRRPARARRRAGDDDAGERRPLHPPPAHARRGLRRGRAMSSARTRWWSTIRGRRSACACRGRRRGRRAATSSCTRTSCAPRRCAIGGVDFYVGEEKVATDAAAPYGAAVDAAKLPRRRLRARRGARERRQEANDVLFFGDARARVRPTSRVQQIPVSVAGGNAPLRAEALTLFDNGAPRPIEGLRRARPTSRCT